MPRDVSGRLGISPRTLHHVVTREVGLPPTRVLRIRRALRAAHLGIVNGDVRWSVVAYRAGYADQPHLIREFNDLFGESPERYRARRR